MRHIPPNRWLPVNGLILIRANALPFPRAGHAGKNSGRLLAASTAFTAIAIFSVPAHRRKRSKANNPPCGRRAKSSLPNESSRPDSLRAVFALELGEVPQLSKLRIALL